MTIKKALRAIVISTLFLIPIFALIVDNSLFFPFITGKAFYFRLLVEIAFAGWVILAFCDAKYRPKLTALTVGITAFALITLVADLVGVNPIRSLWSNFERMEGWITIIHLWALFIVSSSVFGSGEEGKRLWHRWLNFELVVALAVGLYGLFQLFGWTAIHQGSSRIDASLGNAAYMAVYMLWNAGLALYLFFVARAKKIANSQFLVWAYPVLAVFFSFLLFETATRGTILGWTGGVMLGLFLYAVINKGQSKRSRQVAGGVLILIVVLGLGIWLSRNVPAVKNSPIFGRLTQISLSDSEATARLYIWSMALNGWTHRPILGWGQENFNYIFNANYNPHMWNQEQWFDRAHSVYLDWLTASGVVGLLAYLALYVLFLTAVWKSSLTIAEKCVLIGLGAAYAIHNIFVFDNLASYVLFFAALAFVDSFRAGKPLAFFGTAPASKEAVEYVAAPAVIVLLVFVAYFFSVRPLEANTRLIGALENCQGGSTAPDPTAFQSALAVNTYVANQEIREQLLSCAGPVISAQSIPGPTKQAFYQLATQAIQDQIAATPWKDARIYAIGGSFMNSIQQFPQAASLLQDAHELSLAKQSIDLELANSLLNTGQATQAAILLGQAYQSDMTDTQVKTAYVLALIASGQEAQAHAMFGDDPSLFQNDQVGQAYLIAKDYPKAIAIFQAIFNTDQTNIQAAVDLAQAQYAAGESTQSIQTMRLLEKSHPEYATQIEASIKELQAQK